MPKDLDFSVPVSNSETVFSGKIWDVLSETFDYSGFLLTREFVKHPGAVAVLATDSLGRVLMIQQYRHPVGKKLWEIPAGLLDVDGELPVDAAQRELIEETGYRAGQLRPLIEFYTTPGGNSEKIQVFHGTDLEFVGHLDGVGEESDMQVEWVAQSSAITSILHSEIMSPSAVVAILALAVRAAQSEPR